MKNKKSQKSSIYYFFISLNRFRRSSLLSISVLAVILLMVQGFDQAYTLLIDMIERDHFSLILCYILIAMFALVVSHYPIYTYYAKDINNSKDDHVWFIQKWLGVYPIYTFKKKSNSYEPDYLSKYFRYCLGLIIFCIWHYYIYKSFQPKFLFIKDNIFFVQAMNWICYLVPFILLAFALYQKSKKNVSIKKGVLWLFINFSLVIGLLITLLFCTFSYTSYWILQLTTFMLSLLYILFRLYRGEIAAIGKISIIRYISNVFNYLLLFFIFSIVVLLLLLYCNIAVPYDLPTVNAMVILLAYFYIIYYILACTLKYIFMVSIFRKQPYEIKMSSDDYKKLAGFDANKVSKLIDFDGQKKFAVIGKIVIPVVILAIVGAIVVSLKTESSIHQLQTSNTDIGKTLKLQEFKNKIYTKLDKPVFFVASHGGALKANVWTMKILQKLEKETQGEFLNQTVSFSGASGGMMGLSLYSVLAGKYKSQDEIDSIINQMALKKFASKDLSYTFGYDFFRKFYPFKVWGTYKDRSYYAMVAYQNLLERKNDHTLTSESFQSYWYKNIYTGQGTKENYFPALLVNTAKTNGRRGVFCSIDIDKEKIFYNADVLSELSTKETVRFYEAVSTTNRFPLFSPAAKIKGYGHYIDAGAIDNSGLLSSLDLYYYLKKDKEFEKAQKIFVEIVNSKSIYINHLIRKFKDSIQGPLLFNEIEQDNIAADLKTGFNLDKIPNYLSDFMKEGLSKDPTITYIPIYLPRKVSIDDLEKVIGGTLEKSKRKEIEDFLKKENNKIIEYTDKKGTTAWQTYEPTLARHLSQSTLNYYQKVLDNDVGIKNNIATIKKRLKKK